jgi:hypothetical protein
VTHEEHRARHAQLYQAIHELARDHMEQTGRLPSETSVGDLVRWAQRQAECPTRNEYTPEEELHLPVIEVDRG